MKRTFRVVLDFEKPVVELQKKIAEMEQLAKETGVNVSEDAKRLKKKADSLQKEIYAKLTPWQRVQLARHSDRPFTLDYIERIADDFVELHGDRYYADDAAMITGMARIEDFRVMLIGQQKGRDVKENLHRNFGMSNPEGYRKALRVMKLAAKFNMPIITFIDTPGATRASGRKNAARRKRSPAICWRWPACRCR